MILQTTRFSIAAQSAKGTAASSNFIGGRMQTSGLNPRFDKVDVAGEHTGVHQRATSMQSTPIRTAHIADFTGTFRMYPAMIGYVLKALGFAVSTAVDTPVAGAYTHTFTLGDVDTFTWASVLFEVGEDSARYGRLGKDARLSQWVFTADNTGLVNSITGIALSEANDAGTETVTADNNALLSNATGAFTVTSSDITAATLGTPRRHEFTFDNPLDDTEQQLHSFARATASPTGAAIRGTIGGLVFSENIYKELNYGASGGTAPVVVIPEAQLVWSFNSSTTYITGTTAYSIQWTLPLVQVEFTPFDVTGGGQVLYDATYEMLDVASGTNPCTIVLINGTTSYAGT